VTCAVGRPNWEADDFVGGSGALITPGIVTER
jgi:hypothetical protein